MPRAHPRLIAALVASAAAFGIIGWSLASPGTAQAISCSTTSGEGRNFYRGPMSSNVYDTRFHRGPALSPNLLDSHVPQGLATWENFYGDGADLLVYTAYNNPIGPSVSVRIRSHLMAPAVRPFTR